MKGGMEKEEKGRVRREREAREGIKALTMPSSKV